MHPILEYIYNLLPPDKKQRNNGWIYFNAQGCCENYGHENADSKHRGNIYFTDDGFVYSCFNCHYSCGYTLGNNLSSKTYQWIKWLGATQKEINDLLSLIHEYNDSKTPNTVTVQQPKRIIRHIPDCYKSINYSYFHGETSKSFNNVFRYIQNRNSRLFEFNNYMWAEGQNHFLIPCYEYGNVVGYSLRSLDDYSPSKYIHLIPRGYVYKYDNFLKNRKYQILVEGQLDADSINGIAYLSSTITPERLKRILPYTNTQELIICPDRDNAGKKIVQQVLDENLPFSIAFPNWIKGIKDCEEAVQKYGRLYTIYSIISSKESNKDLIKMKSMKWFS